MATEHDESVIIAAFVVVWVLIGASVGFYEVRRGHWRWLWLLGAIVGPGAIPLARLANQREPYASPVVLAGTEAARKGGLRVLAGVDGSEHSTAAVETAAHLLGPRIDELILATVVDFETVADSMPGTSAPEDSWASPEERRIAADLLQRSASAVAPHLTGEPTTVLLAGNPSDALHGYAQAHDIDLVVVGTRGHGLAKRLLGSCASRLARQSDVPVFIVRDNHVGPRAGPVDSTVTV